MRIQFDMVQKKKEEKKNKGRKLIVSVEYQLASEFVKRASEAAMLHGGQAPVWPDKYTNPIL